MTLQSRRYARRRDTRTLIGVVVLAAGFAGHLLLKGAGKEVTLALIALGGVLIDHESVTARLP